MSLTYLGEHLDGLLLSAEPDQCHGVEKESQPLAPEKDPAGRPVRPQPGDGSDFARVASYCADLLWTHGVDPEVAQEWVQAAISLAGQIPEGEKREEILHDSLCGLAEVLRRAGRSEAVRDVLAEAERWRGHFHRRR